MYGVIPFWLKYSGTLYSTEYMDINGGYMIKLIIEYMRY